MNLDDGRCSFEVGINWQNIGRNRLEVGFCRPKVGIYRLSIGFYRRAVGFYYQNAGIISKILVGKDFTAVFMVKRLV